MKEPASPPSALLSHSRSRSPTGFLEREGEIVYQVSTMKTPYMVMALQANEALPRDNIRAALSSWLILAGYVVFSGTFTFVKNSGSLEKSKDGKVVKEAIQYVPLLPFAIFCCLVGIYETVQLWKKWQKNYVWLVANVFMPGLLNSTVGLINTLVNVYTSHGGYWSAMATCTVVVTSLCMAGMSALTLVYNNWLLEKIKTPYDRDLVKQGAPGNASNKANNHV